VINSTHEKTIFDEHRKLVDDALRAERIKIDELLKESSELTSRVFSSRVFSSMNNDQIDVLIRNVLAMLTRDEKELVAEVLEIERIGIDELMKRGLMSLVKTCLSSAANKKRLGFDGLSYNQLSELGNNRSTIRGLASAKIDKVFEAIQQFNQDQVDEEKRIYVSQNSIYQITNSNLDAIKKWLKENKAEILKANVGSNPKRRTTRIELREILSEYFDRATRSSNLIP